MKTDSLGTILILTLTRSEKKKPIPKQVYKILHLLCFCNVTAISETASWNCWCTHKFCAGI